MFWVKLNNKKAAFIEPNLAQILGIKQLLLNEPIKILNFE